MTIELPLGDVRLVRAGDTMLLLELTAAIDPAVNARAIVVAIAGADLSATLDDAAVPMHASFTVAAGQRLRFGAKRTGARAYVSVDGGIDVPLVLGSRATHLPARMGGWAGRALCRGDRLPLGPARLGGEARVGRAVFIAPSEEAVLRLLPGPHADRFLPAAAEVLYGSTFTLAGVSNRMGYRLEGPRLPRADTSDIISEAVAMGALQVPASGQPILLMADRQTTGGYPTIGNVIAADLPVAGQLAPGDRVRFVPCTDDAARAALVEQEGRLR